MKTTELAFAAGFFDGEGYIGISYSPKRRAYQLIAQVSQNNGEILAWMAERFGGKPRYVEGTNKGVPFRRWDWKITTAQAAEFLRAIQPWAIVKRAEIKVALAFQASMGQRAVSPEVQAFRHQCYEDIRKCRGTQAI